MYQWFVFVHLIGLVVFVLAHGASAFIALRLPAQRNPTVVASYLETSNVASQTMYVGLVLLLIGGAGAATINDLWTRPWILGSIVVLVVVIAIMYALGTGYYNSLRSLVSGDDGAPPSLRRCLPAASVRSAPGSLPRWASWGSSSSPG